MYRITFTVKEKKNPQTIDFKVVNYRNDNKPKRQTNRKRLCKLKVMDFVFVVAWFVHCVSQKSVTSDSLCIFLVLVSERM